MNHLVNSSFGSKPLCNILSIIKEAINKIMYKSDDPS